MIRHDHVASALRFYASDTPGPFEPYVATCTLLWETNAVVWIVGMHGAMSRKHVREMVQFLHAQGVTTAKAHRHPSHRLPFGVDVGDHVEMNVAAVAARGWAAS